LAPDGRRRLNAFAGQRVFFVLESRGFDCQLYNAAQVKALPGRAENR
jgi:hypothetical protein